MKGKPKEKEGEEPEAREPKDEASAEPEKAKKGPKEESKEEDAQKISNEVLFLIVVAGLVAIILLIIGIGKVLPGKTGNDYQEYTYNGFSVLNISGQWYTHIQLPERNRTHVVEMRNGPMEVELYPMELGVKEMLLQARAIYLTTDPDLGSKVVVGMIEVGRILGERYDIYDIPTKSALTRPPETGEVDVPIITCDNATEAIPVVYFTVASPNLIHKEGNCVIVQGETEDDVILASDKLGYALIGVVRLE